MVQRKSLHEFEVESLTMIRTWTRTQIVNSGRRFIHSGLKSGKMSTGYFMIEKVEQKSLDHRLQVHTEAASKS